MTSKTLWTSSEIAAATGGAINSPDLKDADFTITGLSIDTRDIGAGDLFIPLKAERDGHDFIANAFRNDATATLSEVPINGHPGVIVDNTMVALNALGIAARDRSSAIRIGITGSVGKTSLKEALATVCEAAGPTHKSVKSFNNHWGVPLTLARMPRDTQYGVFEMGMSAAGELTELSALVRPDIAVITKIAPAHLAHFDSVDAIARAKAEIYSGIADGGTAIINLDCAYGPRLAKKAQKSGATILTVGKSDKADFRIGDVQALANGSVFALHHTNENGEDEIHPVLINIAGDHWVTNAALAVATAHAAGIAIADAIESLTTLGAIKGRGERFDVDLNGAQLTIIDESYNANPESMRAAITAIGDQPNGKAGRKLAILGSMLELGADELDMHAALSHPLVREGFARVFTVGETMRALKGALPQKMRGPWCKDADAAWHALLGEAQDGDTILIKGSNGAGLGALVERLHTVNFSAQQRGIVNADSTSVGYRHAL